MSKYTDFVAEYIFGLERKPCQGSFGGGNTTTNGPIITWFRCDWCNGVYYHHKLPFPYPKCPKYPFPSFTLPQLMQALGKRSIAITLRNGPYRENNTLTLIGPAGRICDTDEPLEALCRWVFETVMEHCPPELENRLLVETGMLARLLEEAEDRPVEVDWMAELEEL